MPYKRTFRKKSRALARKGNRRRGLWNTNKATGRRMLGPIENFMPNSCIRKLKYTTAVTIAPGAASSALHAFRSNGIYDPDVTGTGHQPRGFDQLMAAYNKWTVVGSKITVTQNRFVTNAGWLFLTHSMSSNPLTGTTADATRFENSLLVKRPIVIADNSGGARKTRISGMVSMKKFRKSKVLNEDDYSGTASADPSDQSYWTIYYQNEGGNTPDSTTFLVELEYIVVFRDPKTIASS